MLRVVLLSGTMLEIWMVRTVTFYFKINSRALIPDWLKLPAGLPLAMFSHSIIYSFNYHITSSKLHVYNLLIIISWWLCCFCRKICYIILTFILKPEGIIFFGQLNSVLWMRIPDSSSIIALKSGLKIHYKMIT